jgi:flagellar protein FlaJ
MSLELLSKNIEREGELMKTLLDIYNQIESLEFDIKNNEVNAQKIKVLDNSINPILEQIRIINSAFPDLINQISFFPVLGEKKNEKSSIVNVKYNNFDKKTIDIAVRKSDQNKFLENAAKENFLSKKNSGKFENTSQDQVIILSNKMFGKYANNLIDKGYFSHIKLDLRKITSPFLINSYVSMMFFSTFLFFIIGVILGGVFFFIDFPAIASILAVLGLPIIGFLTFFYYPSSKRKSLEKDINQELPFVTIYLSAIATSGIEPSKIFNILVNSKEYPTIQREMKKLTNLVNFYGYDLVSALKIMTRTSPSDRLSQLFDGLATTITSGGELTEFLNKHSESLLFDYRLEREKYTRLAETFMNIYISIVIAAPMIMMILFILMSVTNLGVGNIGVPAITLVTILTITLLNLGFLVLLNLKQPKF